jgi:hypothetical protein
MRIPPWMGGYTIAGDGPTPGTSALQRRNGSILKLLRHEKSPAGAGLFLIHDLYQQQPIGQPAAAQAVNAVANRAKPISTFDFMTFLRRWKRTNGCKGCSDRSAESSPCCD